MTFSLTFSELRGNFTTSRDEGSSPSNPYLVLKAGGQKTQTKALKGVEEYAEWREMYTLHDIPEKSGGVLEVIVHNHKTLLPDDTIGSGTANISSWSGKDLTGQGDITVQLIDKKGRGAGNLTFHARHSNFTVEAARRSVSQMAAENQAGAANQTAGGLVDGIGAGTTYEAAKEAAAKAAREQRNVTIDRANVIAAGKPVSRGANVAMAGQQEVTPFASRHADPGHQDLQYEAAHTGGSPRSPKMGPIHSEKAYERSNGKGNGVPLTGVRGGDVKPGEIIDRKFYTGTENRPQEQALVEQYREHHPFTRRYETTVEHTGRERQIGSRIETLGTEEEVVASKNNINVAPHEAIKSVIPAGASDQQIGGDGWVQGQRGPVCDSKTFEITGDVTVDKKRVTNLREHRDFEKEFEIKTTFIEEVPLTDKQYVEQLSRERLLRNEKPKVACEGHKGVSGISPQA